MNALAYLQDLLHNLWFYGGVFIIVLSILVFVHEWGHYIVARMCGVRVETFSIGFGKEIWGRTDAHGTRWKLSIIPLGGYVKMFGDVDAASAGSAQGKLDEHGKKIKPYTKKQLKEAFFAQKLWKRSAVVFAGPAINYIFAVILLTGLYMSNGQIVVQPVASAVMGGSSAEEAGFLPHDRILSIDGKEMDSFNDIRREMTIVLDEQKHFVIERNAKIIDIYASPKKITSTDDHGFSSSRGLLGLMSTQHAIKIDRIASINGKAYDDVELLRAALLKNMKKQAIFTIGMRGNGDTVETLKISPLLQNNEAFGGDDEEDALHNVLVLANQDGDVLVKRGPLDAMSHAVGETISITQGTLHALGQIVTGSRSAKELGGVIRIGALAGDMAQQGIIAVVLFMALLSINLGLINLFPIPLLDGGHLVFYAAEAVLRRPIPEQIQEYAFRFGLVFLVGLMFFANMNDLIQLFIADKS